MKKKRMRSSGDKLMKTLQSMTPAQLRRLERQIERALQRPPKEEPGSVVKIADRRKKK
jgi:hypothetical protein